MSVKLPEVYLVRHGETAWSITGQHTGRTDIPLTAQGEDAAQKLKSRLSQIHFENVFTSPLLRATQTAQLAGYPQARADADLMEWDYGAYEGRRTVEIRTECRPGGYLKMARQRENP